MNGSLMMRKVNPLPNQRGFTLVEVAVAVFILGLAFTQLIAWQTRQLDTYINERSRIKAALFAQYLMTMIEVQDSAPDLGTDGGKLEDQLRDEGYFEADDLGEKGEDLADWEYKQTVTKIDVAPRKDVLRRIELEISWGQSPDQVFALLYFVRTSGNEGEEESDGSQEQDGGDDDA